MPTKKDRRTARRRTRVTREDLTPAPIPRRRLTAEQKALVLIEREKMRKVRQKAMLDANIIQVDIVRALEARGVRLSHVSVGNVIRGTFRNGIVESVFCELTNTTLAVMFPAEAPINNNAASA